VWWVEKIFHIGAGCGMTSPRRRSGWGLIEVVRRKIELRRMFIFLQRERRKEILGGN
jgi:hypothetical protein